MPIFLYQLCFNHVSSVPYLLTFCLSLRLSVHCIITEIDWRFVTESDAALKTKVKELKTKLKAAEKEKEKLKKENQRLRSM